MRFSRALRPGRRRHSRTKRVNITSFVDIMLVLVLFSAFRYATQSNIATETRAAALPATRRGHMDTTGLHVVLNMDSLRVEDVQVATLDNGVLAAGPKGAPDRLQHAIAQAVAQRKLESIGEESLINRAPSSGWLYLDASHNIPYTTIEAVTRSAQAAGLEHFRLIVHAER